MAIYALCSTVLLPALVLLAWAYETHLHTQYRTLRATDPARDLAGAHLRRFNQALMLVQVVAIILTVLSVPAFLTVFSTLGWALAVAALALNAVLLIEIKREHDSHNYPA